MAKKTEVRIEPVEKGFIVHHSQDTVNGPYKSPVKHLFTDAPSMVHHITKTFMPKGKQSFKDALKELKGK
jgi:hypothetical protein